MGVARAGNLETVGQSNAQFSGGSLKFDSTKSHHLTRSFSSSGNRRKSTLSIWVKRYKPSSGVQQIFSGGNSSNQNDQLFFDGSDRLCYYSETLYNTTGTIRYSTARFRDVSAWYHVVFVIDTENSNAQQRARFYVNGVELTAWDTNYTITQNADTYFNTTTNHYIGRNSTSDIQHPDANYTQIYWIDGQTLDPSYFGYTDPLTNTWRPKKYTGTFTGTNTFYLPFDGNTLIGQDRSGNNNNWTPVNFGGSNTLEKATGALPILNTDGGGKVARVGVRTDSNASSLVLALPLVGIRSDFSNAINSGTSNKTVTNNSVSFGSTISNFYSGSAYLSDASSQSFAFGNYGTDFQFTGDYTIECWVYPTTNSAADGSLFVMQSGSAYFAFNFDPGTQFNIYNNSSSGPSWSPSVSSIAAGQWNHIALVRSGSTQQIFVNGISIGTNTASGTHGYASADFARIGGGAPGAINSYIQDFRIYKGLAKYTQNFIPASTDPNILPDTPSGVSYSSNLNLVPNIDGGSVAFDGTGDTLTLASNADFQFGTGDFTVEAFVYKDANDADAAIFDLGSTNTSGSFAIFWNSDSLVVRIDGLGNDLSIAKEEAPANRWIHIAVTRSGSTLRLFVDGALKASGTRSNNITQSTPYIGDLNLFDYDFTGFISNFHIVKGTALYTSNFTPPTGPISSVANTKLLCCKSQTSATASDVTPGTITANGNAVATNFNPFTVNINAVRGQESGYCTLNPLDNNGGTLSDGNLTKTSSAGASNVSGTISMPSGKWYWEVVISGSASGGVIGIGAGSAMAGTALSNLSKIYGWAPDGNKYANTTASSYAGSYTVGDVIGVSFDADTRQLTFYKNNISQGVAFTVDSGFTYFPQIHLNVMNVICNFGQKPFRFPPPTGFQPLALANTPRPTIVRPDQYVGIVTYTGTGSTRDVVVGWKPDLVWIKSRSDAQDNNLFDSVRGPSSNLYALQSNATSAEGQYNTFSSLNSRGFTLGPQAGALNGNGTTNVAWCWKAGGNSNTYNINDIGYSTASAAGLTAGSITPTGASVNTKSGFSIITYTGTNANATISHGLGNVPAFIIAKSRDTSSWNWIVYHKSLGVSDYLALESTQGSDTRFANIWGTGHTTSVFGVRTGYSNNPNGERMVAYCWAEIPGFSKFGSYTGNGNANGPVVVTEFRPRWLMIKQSSASGENWRIFDTTRDPYNAAQNRLLANSAATEGVGVANELDILSNGFKLRSTDGASNGSGATYIYAAFAESPTFNLYGGQSNAR